MKLLKAGLLAALIAGAQPAASETTIVFNNFLSPNDALWTDVMLPWIADVEKATEGRVKFTVPASSLAPPPELLNAVQQGVADGAFQMVSFLRAAHPELQMPLLPMTYFGNEETSVALWRTYEKFFKGKNDLKDVELLGLVTTPPNSLINMKPTPFQSVADIKGVKFWSLPGIPAETLTALGAVVTPGPAVRMYEVISGGVVDAFCCINYESLEVFNVAQYIGAGTDIPGHLFAPAFAVFVRADVFAGISAEDQAAIRAVSGEVLARRGSFGDPVEAAARQRIAAMGKTVVPASETFVAELEAAVAPVRAAWIEATKAKGIDAAAALDYYLAQQAAVKAGN
ncbi:MAG: TRAP transporter substrate-binding protein DctP [Gemmobacter sp.]|jgi:TRAP-type transport system periplasmic protein|nr:TRAP transporter substrate-binding protein DctP [Gemmobacter sp.]